MTRSSHIEYYKDRRGKWRIRVRAANGKIPGQEAFASKSNAIRAARALSQSRMVIVEVGR